MIFFGHEDPDGPDWSLSWGPLLTPEEQTELERMSAEMGRQAGQGSIEHGALQFKFYSQPSSCKHVHVHDKRYIGAQVSCSRSRGGAMPTRSRKI